MVINIIIIPINGRVNNINLHASGVGETVLECYTGTMTCGVSIDAMMTN